MPIFGYTLSINMVISFKSKGSCSRALVSVEIDDRSYLFFSFSLLTYKKELFCQWQLSFKDGGNTKMEGPKRLGWLEPN